LTPKHRSQGGSRDEKLTPDTEVDHGETVSVQNPYRQPHAIPKRCRRGPKLASTPVTNIRNTSSPHWRGWLKPENRCLAPANSFSEYTPEPNPLTKKKTWSGLP
jgi:putative SOS response-associated peptidase YedK